LSGPNASYTAEFKYEFAAQMGSLLNRRFLWFSGIMGVLGILSLGPLLWLLLYTDSLDAYKTEGRINGDMLGSMGIFVAWTALYVGAFLYAALKRPPMTRLVWLSVIIVSLDGLINIAMRVFDLPMASGLLGFLISFTIAASFLPWTVRQALIVAGTVMGVNAICRLTPIEGSLSWNQFFIVLVSSLFILPGFFISWYRASSRLRDSQFHFLQRRYGEVRRELTDARRIHEAMFPAPVTTGEVRFTYRYQPMRQIGGDYLHINACKSKAGEDEAMSVVVLDVTGHGIPAALTVNRLYGELARLYAEDPEIEPGHVLALLNRYVRLTMATHSVFVTGLAVKIDPSHDEMLYANAGHPPAFHIRADGLIDQLDSTTFLLGAVDDETFDSEMHTVRFAPGDRFVAYTDGATEARCSKGKMLGIQGMQGILSSVTAQSEGGWPATVLSAVDHHRGGPPDDDTLVIEIYRPVRTSDDRARSREVLVSESISP
jgi:serine phosphatase RsbU (regulator of sigma subunit)